MSDTVYSHVPLTPACKPLFVLKGEIKTPPIDKLARREAGDLLRQLQDGVSLGLPHSRPLPTVGPQCHELRVKDSRHHWRIVYRLDCDAVLVASIFAKKGKAMQNREFRAAAIRSAAYDKA